MTSFDLAALFVVSATCVALVWLVARE